ncbi:MAG: hypothetical protein GY863_13820, partial [bacterium]|nr:hypothetical protein [bacterium]
LAFLLEANSIDPDNIVYREAIAAFYLQKDKADEAWKFLSGSDIEKIDRPEALILLAEIANRQGNKKAHLNALEKLMAVSPKVSETVQDKVSELRKELG